MKQLCLKKSLTVDDVYDEGSKIQFFDGVVINLSGVDLTYVRRTYYQIKTVCAKNGRVLARRQNQYSLLLSEKSETVSVNNKKIAKSKDVQANKLEKLLHEDNMKLERKYQKIADKIQSIQVVRLTNEERKEVTMRLKRLGQKKFLLKSTLRVM